MLKKIENYTKEEFQQIISESTSISEILRKIGYPPYGKYHTELTKYIKDSNFDTSSLKGRHIKRYDDTGIPKKSLSDVLVKNSTGNSNKLRERLIRYGVKQYRCENPKCGISEWCGEPIVLQLHHINGDHYDNRLENLVLLCPNCHSQTSNFTSKNSDNSLNEILKKIAIDESKNGIENLLRYEEERKNEILENRKKYRSSPVKEKKKEIKYCSQCGKPITGNGTKFCSVECMVNYQREKSGILIEDVIEKSKECKSICELARYFNLSDNGLKKRLRSVNKLEEVKENLNKNKKDNTILQFDLNNNFIKEWENAIVASEELKINKTHIYNCCRNIQKTCSGYIWKFKNR